jgi:hypothetical protein
VLLFHRLEAEDEDQGIDSLEKELADVSWSDWNLSQCFSPELYQGGGTISCPYDSISVDELLGHRNKNLTEELYHMFFVFLNY